MEIRRASEMGFCFGVRRAIELVERAAGERGPLQTLGALVHNRQVVERLAACGVGVASSLDEISGSIVAIASHGVGPDTIDELKTRNLEIIDATCPFVRKAQMVSQKLGKAGFGVLVYGDASHPEVRGVLGWAGDGAIASLDVPKLALPSKLGIICQTTQSQDAFARFVAGVISDRFGRISELRIFNTICDATRRHQAAALELSGNVDLMLVVGGQDSANTRRLARICAETGVTTFHIEAAEDIVPSWLQHVKRVGITAGASTPDEVIDEVVSALDRLAGKK